MAKKEIVGAAQRYVERRFKGQREPDSSWQRTAWDLYDSTPELRFAANWIGNAMSRARLYAGKRSDDGTVEPVPDDHPAAAHVASIAGGPTGQSELLGEYGPHLVVAGEGWTVIRPNEDENATQSHDWRVLSVLEVIKKGRGLEAEIDGDPFYIPPYDPDNPDQDEPAAIRVWDPHPRRYIEADSPIRSSLGLLEELRLLNAAVAAIAKSRLRGRGVLFVPQGTKFPTPPTQGGAEDDLLEVFMTVAETAYREPDSAAAGVPIILEVPEAVIDKWQWLTFESDFDELAVKLREECIRRFATGLEIPAEVLLGMGDVNHWGVWALQEEAIRLAIEPRLATVADAYTKQWLQPMLEDQNVADADECMVWYDTSPLRVRQNRAQTAIEVYREGGIGLEALRRETGFEDGDAPDPSRGREDLLVRLVSGAPSLAPLILPLLGFDLAGGSDGQLTTTTGEGAGPVTPTSTAPGEAAPAAAPRLPTGETTGPPTVADQPDLAAGAEPTITCSAGLAAAVDGLIYRALERAGVKHRGHQPRSVRPKLDKIPAACMHIEVPIEGKEKIDEWRLFDQAWDRVPEIAERYGVDSECLTTTLNDYCVELFAAGVTHTFDMVPAVVAPCLDGSSA